MKTRLSRVLLTVMLAVSMTVSMMPSFAFAEVTEEPAAEAAQQQEPAETTESEDVSEEPETTDDPEKPETVTEDGTPEEPADDADKSDDSDAVENEAQPSLLKAPNGDGAKAPEEETEEELPSGTSSRIKWHLERNDDGAIALVLDDAPRSVTQSFINEVKQACGDYAGQIEEFVASEGVRAIDSYAFEDFTSLKKVTLSSTVEALSSFAFYGCTSLEEINLPEKLTRIGQSCFRRCTSLKQINFPDSLKVIDLAAFYDCTELNNVVIPNAKNQISIGSIAFEHTPNLTDLTIEQIQVTEALPGFPALTNLTVGDSVDGLNSDYIVRTLNNGGNVIFEGENDISLNKGPLKQKAKQPFPEIEGDYYADDQGALYKLNDDGTASLAYCSKGPTTLTIPEKITTVAGETYDVTEVLQYAFSGNEELEAVTFEEPSKVSINSHAFGKSNVKTVNGEDTIDPADFDDVSSTCDFPLASESGGELVEEADSTINGVMTASIFFSNEKEDDGSVRLLTGESGRLYIDVNNQENSQMQNAVVRVYLRAEGDGFNLGSFNEPGKTYDVIGKDVNGEPKKYTLKFGKTSTPNLFYYDISGWAPGDTLSFANGYTFDPISSDGGSLTAWVVTMTEEEYENARVQRDPSGKYIKAVWETEPEDFNLKKESASYTPNVNTTVDNNGVPRNFVKNLGYVISINASEPRETTNGADYVKYIEFEDVLKLPEGLKFSEEFRKTINDKTYTLSGSGNDPVSSITVKGSSASGSDVNLLSVSNAFVIPTEGVDLSFNDDGELVMRWRSYRRSGSKDLKINDDDQEYAPSQYNSKSMTMTVSDGVIELDGEETLIDEDGNIKSELDPIHNTVKDTQIYSYSEPRDNTAEADSKAIKVPSGVRMVKSGGMNMAFGGADMGEDLTYKIDIYNDGVTTYSQLKGGSVRDHLSHMIALYPDDMEKMFNDEKWGKNLTITISPATLTKVQSHNAVDINGNQIEMSSQITSGSDTAYHGCEDNDPTEITTQAQMILHWDGDHLVMELSDPSGAVASKTLTIGSGGDYSTIKEALDSLGYVITYYVSYDVRWDLSPEQVIYGSSSLHFEIPHHVKTTLMLLRYDNPHRYYNSYTDYYRNTAYAYSAADRQLMQATASAGWVGITSVRASREMSLNKTVKVNGETFTNGFSANAGDVVDYTLSFNDSSYDEYYPSVLPLVDKVQGAQQLIVPIAGNESATYNGSPISEAGLETITSNGVEYYILHKTGEYKSVKVGGKLADSVKVSTVTKADVQSNPELTEGLDTLITWYYQGISSSNSITYKTIIDPVNSGFAAPSADSANKSFPLNNETWLGDHQTHRLYAALPGTAAQARFIKWILDDDGTLKRHTAVKADKEVTYKIIIENTSDYDMTLTGKQIYDSLPTTSAEFAWLKGNNIYNMRYETKDAACSTTDDTYWWVDSIQPDTGADMKLQGQYYIHWTDEFQVDFKPHGELDIYVTLHFPAKDGDEWNRYIKKINNASIVNTFFLDKRESAVTHDLIDDTEVVLRKGVFDTGWHERLNDGYTRGVSRNTRLTYANGSDYKTNRSEPFPFVVYYTTLYNSGNMRLYLEDMEDQLPKGFHLLELLTIYGANRYFDPFKLIATEGTSGQLSNYWMWYVPNNKDPFAKVEDPDRTVSYVNARIEAQVLGEDSEGREHVKYNITPGSNNYNGSKTLKYDSDAKKYYLAPGECVRFGYVCQIDSFENTDDIAENNIAMPYYDYYGMPLSVDSEEKVHVQTAAGIENNDGGCDLIDQAQANLRHYTYKDGDDTTQWISSDVSLERGEITPGLQKTVGGTSARKDAVSDNTVTQGSTSDYGTKYSGSVLRTEVVNWKLRVFNESRKTADDSNVLTNYTITDTVQAPYAFTGEVFLNMGSSTASNVSGSKVSAFTIGDRHPGDTEIPIHCTLPGNSGSSWYKPGSKVGGLVVNGPAFETRDCSVQLLRDDDGTETLKITFKGDRYRIPDKHYADICVHTLYNADQLVTSETYVNNAILHTEQSYDPNTVSQGRNLTDPDTGDVLTGDESGIESSATVSMVSGFNTSAYKTITEIDNETNHARSDEEHNYIALSDKENQFRYDLYVNTPDDDLGTLTRFILIDSLPERDDHSPFEENVARESEFTVSIVPSSPDFKVGIKTDKGEEVTLTEDQYTLYLNTKTSFNNDDWEGAGTGWVKVDENITEEQIAAARSIRVVIKDETKTLMPPKSRIHIEFRGFIDDEESKPGQIAWNSFGYRYTVNPYSLNITLNAEPLKVGILYPEAPKITKKTKNQDNEEFKAFEDTKFRFVIYQGDPVSELNDAYLKTDMEIGNILKDNLRPFTVAELTLPEGESTVRTEALGRLKLWELKDGKLTETDKDWTWTDGKKYTVFEVATEEGTRYRPVKIGGKAGDSYTFTQDKSISTVIVAENRYTTWKANIEFEIEKYLDEEISGLPFAFRIQEGSFNDTTGKFTAADDGLSEILYNTESGKIEYEKDFVWMKPETHDFLIKEITSDEVENPELYTLDDAEYLIRVEGDTDAEEGKGILYKIIDGKLVRQDKPTAEYNNTRKRGSLEVSKTVKSPSAGDKTRDYEFTVTLNDKTVNGKYGDMTFENGVATFTLRDGEKKTATGLLKGITYTVKETAVDGFETESTGETGTIDTTVSEAVFTNTRKTGNLEISKIVKSDAGEDSNKRFEFTVKLGDQTISGTYGDITFDRGLAKVYLKHGESAAATGLPAGITYTVTEKEEPGFTIQPENASGTIKEGKASVKYTNSRNTGDLEVSKAVVSDLAADKDKVFKFTVDLTDKTINGKYGDMTFENGVANIELKGGESLKAVGLPSTIGYVVVEEADPEFVRSPETVSDNIVEGQTLEAKFTNTRKTGDLEVSKAVVSDLAADKDRVFKFTVTLNDETINGTYGDMTFENGVANIELKGGESLKAAGLPTSLEYTVEEDDDPGFETDSDDATGRIENLTPSEAKFTNTRKTGDLEVSKAVVSDAAADKDRVFKFTVTLNDETINGTYGDMTFENGAANIELKGGESLKAAGLPTSLGYTVEEADDPGFKTESEGETGTIAEGTSEAKFTNTRKTGGLEVSKKLISDAAADKDQEFEFTVTLNDDTINSGVFDMITKTYGEMTFKNGVATFRLKGGESITAENLPTELEYTVTEADTEGFVVTGKTGDTGVISEELSKAEIENTRIVGNLTVSKTVIGSKAEKARDFSFRVTLDDETINGEYGEMTFVDGVAEFTLTDGELRAATGLPTGIGYTVEEDTPAGCEVTMTGETGTIVEATADRGSARAGFVNVFASGSNVIYGRKIFENGNLSKQSFKFELREKGTGKVLQTAVTDKDGYFFFDPLEYTLNDLANGDGTYDTSREFVYVVKEVVPATADSKGLDRTSNIQYDLSEKEVTVVVTNKGRGLLDVSIKGDLSISFRNLQGKKGVKTGDDNDLTAWLTLMLLSAGGLMAGIASRRRRKN